MDNDEIQQTLKDADNQQEQQCTEDTQISTNFELENLKNKIIELEASLAQYKDLLLRKTAEFENYKKRTDNEFIERIKFANEDLMLGILPIIDDLERSIKMSKEQKDFNVLFRGVELIHQKLLKFLEHNGVKHFEVLGKPFDVNFHDALLLVPRNDVPHNTVVEEVEKGYMFFDKILRHARVIVSNNDNMSTVDNQEAHTTIETNSVEKNEA